MVTKYLWEFATPGGGGFPDDDINDHQAFVNAAAYFQARNGYGTLILDDGEYIIGRQQLHTPGTPLPGPDWEAFGYPSGVPVQCKSLVANQRAFRLDSCFNFTIQGGANTTIRYRDCLYYGTFIQDATTGVISSAVGVPNDTTGCLTCENPLHMPQNLDLGLRHAAVGTMFTFIHCDSITVRDIELNGNIDAAILGGKSYSDGIQTAYDGVLLRESSRCLLDNVHAHHFGKDGLQLHATHTAGAPPFTQLYPGLVVDLDADGSGTVIFNNAITQSSFNWNGRQGISWTGCAGLQVINTDINFNGNGRLRNNPGSGLDIEGGGGPMRVRYGVFDDCRFLHNRLAGVISDNYQCYGQQDFQFNDCTFKSGTPGPGAAAESYALWPEARAMKFYQCEVYGKVNQMFERAENGPHDPDFDLVFRRTNFYEEDEQWNYIGDYSSDSVWTATCAGFDVHKLDVLNGALSGRKAGVVYDSCGFFTNCYANVRFLGRSIGNSPSDMLYPYCPSGSGPYLGADTAQDARYVKLLNSTLTNTGRKRCGAQTPIFSMALTTTTNLVVNRPTEVRGAINASDGYIVPLANYPFESCYPDYCPDPTYDLTDYSGEFPPCKPFFGLSDTVAHWAFCNPGGGYIPTTWTCGNYTLSKTASTTEAYLDSTVTFTIRVCNNSFFATPVLLSEQLPPSFTVTGADIRSGSDTTIWSTTDTTLTLNNGQCVELWITGYFTAFGEFTNTAILDPDTAVAGDELSANATVNVVSTCEANTVIPDGSYASVVGTVFSGTVNIQGLFIVDDDVTFYNAEVFMEAGAEIVVQDGWLLDIYNSSFTACNGVMWRSITAEDGSMVRMRGSFMDDAESLVKALDGSAVWVDNTQFHNNRVAIGIPDEGPTYNNVACWVSNSTFYSQGPMPLPYQGQITAVGSKGFAAVDAHRTTLDFTGGNNIIHHMSNGIVAHGSDVSVSGCLMLAIEPDGVYDYVGNGAGIYAYGGIGWYTLKQEGYGMNGNPSFWDCRWGIYAEYMNVHSTNNHMVEMGTAYRVDRSGYREVDILYNKVFTHFNGMELRFNDGAAHLLVEGNDITFGAFDCSSNCPSYSGINVSEGNYVNQNSVVRNNTIRFLPQASSRVGISLLAADYWVVAENELLMQHNTHNIYGVLLDGCNRAEVSCNTITSTFNDYINDRQAAIRNFMGSDPRISCNDMDRTTNGILFNGVAPGTEVRGNKIRRHKWGLHLGSTAIIGIQELKGNLWYNAAPLGGWGALNQHPFAVLDPFLYNPAIISGGSTQPPSVSPTGWFEIVGGSNYDCTDDEGEDYCSQFNERGKDRLTELDVRVASDSLENDPYTDETKWMLKSRLYEKLDENPEFVDSLQIMGDLYADLQGSATAAFKMIIDEQLHLYDLDSNVVAQMQANKEQVDSLMLLVHLGLEQLGDSTLTSAQRQATLDGISGYREDIRDLTAWNATALQLASGAKVLIADGVRTANAGIITSALIDANQKAVNDIYLATIGKDVDEFTSDQGGVLFDVANQCPMIGGNSVFKARSLYSLIDGAQVFDDSLLCLPYGIVVKSLMEQASNAVSVVPNPASDEASLLFTSETAEPAYLILYNTVSSEVLRVLVPKGVVRHAFSTANITPGLYYYKVLGGGGLVGDGKLTIVR